METPHSKHKIGLWDAFNFGNSLQESAEKELLKLRGALTAEGGDLQDSIPESHSDLMDAALVAPPEKFLKLWAGVNLNSKAAWSSESSKKLKEKYISDHPNLIKEMQDVIVGSALTAVQKGRTALHMAASNGQAEIVSYICVVPGIDMNVQDQFGYTPLHLAAHSPDHDDQRVLVIKELLSGKNINPNLVVNKFHAANMLEDKIFGVSRVTALHLAVRGQFKKAVELLLTWHPEHKDEIINVGAHDRSYQCTPLHFAVAANWRARGEENDEISKALINFIHANRPEALNRRDHKGQTPLHIAITHFNYSAVKTLSRQKDTIKTNVKDINGKTALDIAMDNRDYPMVLQLHSYYELTSNKSKAYSNTANAILVGAALLATVTFTAWLTLPTAGDSQLFWVFNSLCFYFAVSTFLAAATAAMPIKGPPLAEAEHSVVAASFCLAFSIAFAICAFATAGFAIVPDTIKFRRKVIATTTVGAFVCLGFLLRFLRKLLSFSSPLFLYIDFTFKTKWANVTNTIKTLMKRIKLLRNAYHWYQATVTKPTPMYRQISLKEEDIY
jgi:ankyrin repeat protein